MVARVKAKVVEPEPRNGCIYWGGFCVMCPWQKCLLGVSRRQRQWIITVKAIQILDKNNFTTSVICACTKVSKATIYRALKQQGN